MLSAIENNWSAYLILVAYFAVLVVISFISHKKAKTLNEFFMVNRGLGGWMSALAYGVTYFSAVVFIGYAGQFGMKMGLAAVWIGIANAVIGTLLAWMVLASRTRNMSRRLNTKTMPEFLERRYNNKYLKLVSSIIIFIFLIPYSTSVYQGLGYIIEAVFGISFNLCVIIVAIMTAVYLFVGGYFAETLSNLVQGALMITGVILMLVFIFLSDNVNGAAGVEKLMESGYGFFPTFESSGKFIDSNGFTLIIMIILTSFGIWSMPQSIHKFHTIKDKPAIKKGMIISTAFSLIIGGGAYLNGGLSRLFYPNGTATGATDGVITGMFEIANFNAPLYGFIAVLLLAASMSTLSSLSLSSSSTVAIDIYKGYVKKEATDQQTKLVLSIFCVVFIAISALLAILKIDAIVTMMSLSWGTIAGCFIGPYVYGLYSKKTTAASVYASIISCLVITVTLLLVFGFTESPGGAAFGTVLKTGIKRSPLIGVTAMAASMIITPLVSLFTKKPPTALVTAAFAKIEE